MQDRETIFLKKNSLKEPKATEDKRGEEGRAPRKTIFPLLKTIPPMIPLPHSQPRRALTPRQQRAGETNRRKNKRPHTQAQKNLGMGTDAPSNKCAPASRRSGLASPVYFYPCIQVTSSELLLTRSSGTLVASSSCTGNNLAKFGYAWISCRRSSSSSQGRSHCERPRSRL